MSGGSGSGKTPKRLKTFENRKSTTDSARLRETEREDTDLVVVVTVITPEREC